MALKRTKRPSTVAYLRLCLQQLLAHIGVICVYFLDASQTPLIRQEAPTHCVNTVCVLSREGRRWYRTASGARVRNACNVDLTRETDARNFRRTR